MFIPCLNPEMFLKLFCFFFFLSLIFLVVGVGVTVNCSTFDSIKISYLIGFYFGIEVVILEVRRIGKLWIEQQ